MAMLILMAHALLECHLLRHTPTPEVQHSHSHGFHEENWQSSEHGQGAFWKKHLLTTNPVRTWPATDLFFLTGNRWVASRGKRAWNPRPGNQLVSSQGQYICELVPLQSHSVSLSPPPPQDKQASFRSYCNREKETRTGLDSTPDTSWFSTGDWRKRGEPGPVN